MKRTESSVTFDYITIQKLSFLIRLRENYFLACGPYLYVTIYFCPSLLVLEFERIKPFGTSKYQNTFKIQSISSYWYFKAPKYIQIF
jgi:hypothetical protein